MEKMTDKRIGGKNPPSPPIIDTIPFTIPDCLEKYNGTSLKIIPFPIPAQMAIARVPAVYNPMDGEKARMIADIV